MPDTEKLLQYPEIKASHAAFEDDDDDEIGINVPWFSGVGIIDGSP